jgi:hypothetical protein
VEHARDEYRMREGHTCRLLGQWRGTHPQRHQGLKALVRGLKDEAEMEAIAEALEKTHWCRKDVAKMRRI